MGAKHDAALDGAGGIQRCRTWTLSEACDGSLDAGMQDGGGAGPATRAAVGDGNASRPRKTHATSGARRTFEP